MSIGRRLLALFSLVASVFALAAAGARPAAAFDLFEQPKYASIVVDANTGEVLYALHADQRRFPASITKVMTLYLTFEALATGRLSMEDRVAFSAHAAAQAPSKLGVPVGDSLTVRETILGVTVKSANDAASALAERVGGSEARFTQLMTLRAQELGMKSTYYVNANGLPDARQVSSARDIAILARAIMRDYPQYYAFFNAGSMSWQGHEVYNRHSFLQTIPGVDGLKTGYTNAAGHNLVASAVRDGRRLIVTVLGGNSNATRDENVADLFDAGFGVLRKRALGQPITLAALLHEPDDMSGPDVRPPYEMGSGDQSSLRVVVADPMKALGYVAPPRTPEARASVRPATVEARPVCTKLRTGGRHRHRRVEVRCVTPSSSKPAVTIAADDCAGLHGRKLRACKREEKADGTAAATQVARVQAPDCRRLKGRKLRACERKVEADAGPQVAKAQLRDCAKGRQRRHAKACDASPAAEETQTASAGSGSYMIQVGAFPSRTAARNRLTKLSHAGVAGDAKVEGGGKGYRARFGGLSASQARAACGRLSAKGEACLVVAPG